MSEQQGSAVGRGGRSGVTAPLGYQAGGVAAGIKESGEPDVGLLLSERPAAAAAVFTRNVVKAAPLLLDQELIREGRIQAAVVNSGNANCATGAQGLADAREMGRLAAARTGCEPGAVFVSSTGLIGQAMPMAKVAAGIAAVPLSAEGGGAFARAILTTDTVTKEAVAEFEAQGRRYRLGGCCKGAGMIHPEMGTMLAFLTCDAALAPGLLGERLRWQVDRSFNMVTVDGDTSTNDTVLLLANGAAGGATIGEGSEEGEAAAAFEAALGAVCRELAQAIARDGEGATKLIEVVVEGARSWEEARRVARAVVRSPLLKVTVSTGDPEWGRVLSAAGSAGVEFELGAVRVWLGEELLFAGGEPTAAAAAVTVAAVAGTTVRIRLALGQGEESATAWGCDLTEDYVRFNADYVT